MISRALILCLPVLCFSSAAFAGAPITQEEIDVAQKKWGGAIVSIGKAYERQEDYKALARAKVEELYAYGLGDVAFKPTKASEQQFRPTLDEAVSYFVQGVVPEDKGFALQPWSKVRFENKSVVLNDCNAIAMGNYFFTDANSGEEVKVEYTFGYLKDTQGRLRIFLHHSSLPYTKHSPGKNLTSELNLAHHSRNPVSLRPSMPSLQ